LIVVDTNVLCYLHLTGPLSSLARVALQRDPEWLAPLLWRSEFRNALTLYLRKNLLTLAQCRETCAAAEAFMAGREFLVEAGHVLRLAAETGCSAYDCEFAALAESNAVRLVSEDQKVLAAFPSFAVSLKDFAA